MKIIKLGTMWTKQQYVRVIFVGISCREKVYEFNTPERHFEKFENRVAAKCEIVHKLFQFFDYGIQLFSSIFLYFFYFNFKIWNLLNICKYFNQFLIFIKNKCRYLESICLGKLCTRLLNNFKISLKTVKIQIFLSFYFYSAIFLQIVRKFRYLSHFGFI